MADAKNSWNTGQVVDVWEMAEHYGIDDLDGTRPHWNEGRYRPSPVPPPLARNEESGAGH